LVATGFVIAFLVLLAFLDPERVAKHYVLILVLVVIRLSVS